MMGFVLRCLKAAWSLWLAVQVELQGQYSIQRMRDLVEYTEKTSALRVMSVCLFTPVPCLVLMTLIDCVSLARPEAGTDANYVHWCRNYFTVAFISYAILEQFRHTVVGVHLGTWQMMLITALASAAGVGTQYAMSHVIGFPLPFSLVIGTPAWASSMIVLFLFNSSHKFQQSAAFRASMKNFVIVFMGQISLTLIYPAYIFGLVSVRKSLQSSFVLLLPLIKIATKNWISRFLGDLDDMKPEIVVFNIEIFNALYVACSMQNASSLTTSLVLMTLDLLQAWISHRDVDEVIAEINVLMAKIPVKDHAYSGKNCIEVALLIIDDDVKVRTHSSLRMFSLRPLGVVIGPTAAQMKQHVAWPSPAPSFHIPKPGTIVPSSSIPATPPMLLFASEYPMVVLNNTQSSARSQRRDTVQSPSGAKIFTSAERLRFAQKCTRLLFTTEFIILIEYTEVIIPVIYSTPPPRHKPSICLIHYRSVRGHNVLTACGACL